jgi:Tol biopolymer transport system component
MQRRSVLKKWGALVAFGGLAGCQTTPDNGTPTGETNEPSLYPAISWNGERVAFASAAGNLVDGDENENWDIFLYERQTESIERISVSPDGNGGDADSTYPSNSTEGRYIAFTSGATNLVDEETGEVQQVYRYDRETGEPTLVSVNNDGEAANAESYSYFPALSTDGRFIVFSSRATNLAPQVTDAEWQVYVRDIEAEESRLVSTGPEGTPGDAPSMHGVISGDGTTVGFHSQATNLVEQETFDGQDVFFHDVQRRETKLVSKAPDGGVSNGQSRRASLSGDGRFLAFNSQATNLVKGEETTRESPTWGLFFYDREVGEISRVGPVPPSGAVAAPDPKPSNTPSARYISFRSAADYWTDGITNDVTDIFRYDRVEDTIVRVSLGHNGQESNGPSVHHSVSDDGRFVVFSSEATNLVPNVGNEVSDIYLRDVAEGTTSRITQPRDM